MGTDNKMRTPAARNNPSNEQPTTGSAVLFVVTYAAVRGRRGPHCGERTATCSSHPHTLSNCPAAHSSTLGTFCCPLGVKISPLFGPFSPSFFCSAVWHPFFPVPSNVKRSDGSVRESDRPPPLFLFFASNFFLFRWLRCVRLLL